MTDTTIRPIVGRPGDWVETAPGLAELHDGHYPNRIPTAKYTSAEYAARERDNIWMRIWQVAGRESDIPEAGDWLTYAIFDQSFIVTRGRDGVIRGFVNACTHRGNVLCSERTGNTGQRFVCPYHLWSFDLEGNLRGVSRPDLVGDIDKMAHHLVEVPVGTWAGFVFLNPDPAADPLETFLGAQAYELIAPYHLDDMLPVLDVREAIDCNWKVVVDAFQEGYHIQAIHPQLLQAIVIDPTTSRFNFWGDHEVACAPFAVPGADPEDELEGLRNLVHTFPTVTGYLPRLAELADVHRDENGTIRYPEGVTGRTLLQQATRETLTDLGFDVHGLTDAQLTDNHGWLLFPNFFMTIRAAEATVITAVPHPDGDPNRCIWHIRSYMWLPEEFREGFSCEPVEVTEPGTYPYFLALQQDYEQMPRQQLGLRNRGLTHLSLVHEEISVARFHAVLDRYMGEES
jgi:phenylpropionate dioxygenase-like ring-hydroxylating dioxygenase large terminal subunit